MHLLEAYAELNSPDMDSITYGLSVYDPYACVVGLSYAWPCSYDLDSSIVVPALTRGPPSKNANLEIEDVHVGLHDHGWVAWGLGEIQACLPLQPCSYYAGSVAL